MPDGEVVFPFVALASMDRAARQEAIQPLVLTMLPGPPAQKTAVAAVAVTQQAENGVRRERRVANQMVEAVTAAISDPEGFDRDTLAQFPALRGVATDALVTSIKGIPTAARERAADEKVVNQAVEVLKAALASRKSEKDDPVKFRRIRAAVAALTALLSYAQKGDVSKK